MSYQYQQSSGPGDAEFKRKAQLIASNVLKISQNASSIERLLSSSHQDSQAVNQIHSITTYTQALAKDTAADLKVLAGLSTDKSDKLMREKLTSDFTSVLNAFQNVQRSAATKEKQQLREYKYDLQTETQLQPPPQTYKMKEMQIQQDEVQLEELRHREEAIRQLETDILDVNQIFRELATLVHEQGDTVDSIEANIESTAIRVTQGTEQLQKASVYQNSARKKQCIMFTAGAAILIFLILVIYYTS